MWADHSPILRLLTLAHMSWGVDGLLFAPRLGSPIVIFEHEYQILFESFTDDSQKLWTPEFCFFCFGSYNVIGTPPMQMASTWATACYCSHAGCQARRSEEPRHRGISILGESWLPMIRRATLEESIDACPALKVHSPCHVFPRVHHRIADV